MRSVSGVLGKTFFQVISVVFGEESLQKLKIKLVKAVNEST